MIGKAKNCHEYIGPKALFDPNFIPPHILHRKKEEHALYSLLNDSISDEFPLAILYQGIQGIGKKVIVNKVIHDLNLLNENFNPIKEIKIDCGEKTFEEIIVSIFLEMNKLQDFSFKMESLLNSNTSRLWNSFKLACNKIAEQNNLFLILNNVESIKSEYFKKILTLGKETNVTVISTVNKILRTSTLDILSNFDVKEKLNYFTYNELFSILHQRTNLAFKKEIDKEFIEFITDLIFEHYVPIPGKGVDILKELYPYLKGTPSNMHFDLIELCQKQFEPESLNDEFSILTYISEEDIIFAIFLDNLSNYFSSKSNYYITLNELKELYDLSCENLEYEKNEKDFKYLIKITQQMGALNASKIDLKDKNLFFLGMNPKKLKNIVDVVFNKL